MSQQYTYVRPNGQVVIGALAAAPYEHAIATGPNALTIAGYCCALGWLAGGPWWRMIASLAADEVDGRWARASGQTSKFGGELDYAVDVTLTGLCAVKLLGPIGLATLPFITSYQAANRAHGERPEFGSARAVLSGLALLRGV